MPAQAARGSHCPHPRPSCGARVSPPVAAAFPTGADRPLRLPLPAPPKPPDRALCPPRPLPAARPGHHRAGPRALPGRRRLLPLLLPRGESSACPAPPQRKPAGPGWWPSTRVWGCDPLREEVWKDLLSQEGQKWRKGSCRHGGLAPQSAGRRSVGRRLILSWLSCSWRRFTYTGGNISPTSGDSGQLLPLPALW